MRKRPLDGMFVAVSAVDPLNLVGTLLPGEKVPALPGNRVLFRDGVPVGAVVAGKTRYLLELEGEAREAVRTKLVKRSARSIGGLAGVPVA
jgi:ATP-dependent Lhr-like helicase